MRLALHQPDIPQNTGTMIRLCACLGVALDVIEPCGFVFSDTRLRRSGLDYHALATVVRHPSWEQYLEDRGPGRLILLTTRATVQLQDFRFQATDTLLFGAESSGVPDPVHRRADARLVIPMEPGRRSLNVAISGAIALWEGLRQTGGLPEPGGEPGSV